MAAGHRWGLAVPTRRDCYGLILGPIQKGHQVLQGTPVARSVRWERHASQEPCLSVPTDTLSPSPGHPPSTFLTAQM